MTRTTAFVAVLLTTLAVAACDSTEPASDQMESQPSVSDAGEPRSDVEISTAVKAKYYADDTVRGHRIDVDAENGVVTLSGTVHTEDAREKALALARDVEGVTRVNDELKIEAESTADNVRDSASSAMDRAGDAASAAFITTAIQAKYFVADDVKASTIDVTTSNDGVVTLDGTVETEAARNEAVRLARETEGVQRVADRLRIQPDREAETARNTSGRDGESPDAWITMKIQSKYFVDSDVRGRNIDVETMDGKVTLTGMVGSEAERRQAVTLARNTDGVTDVSDMLKVDSTMDRDADAGRTPAAADVERPDSWITAKIQAKYFLDAEVKGHDIDVDTSRGVVTLSGTVESPEQKLEAEQIARETDGVDRVVNQLRVSTATQ
jgi:osmotically-inducible protein OsmY